MLGYTGLICLSASVTCIHLDRMQSVTRQFFQSLIGTNNLIQAESRQVSSILKPSYGNKLPHGSKLMLVKVVTSLIMTRGLQFEIFRG